MQVDDGVTCDKGKEVDLAEMKTDDSSTATRLLPFWNIFLPQKRNR
jgi:hypothetical protein